jgi:hypothetical protein
VLVKARHLLSLKDLNLSDNLDELLQAGISSFKIEGRLKDRLYVRNVVSHYRHRLDAIFQHQPYRKNSSGRSYFDFNSTPCKTFNRGFTTYFLHGRQSSPGSIETPKMMGEFIGTVGSRDAGSFEIETAHDLHKGDGICFFAQNRELCGTAVNEVKGSSIFPAQMEAISVGTAIYRNHDHVFLTTLDKSRVSRKLGLRLHLLETAEGFNLLAMDEDGNQASYTLPCEKYLAQKKEQASENLRRQLTKLGGTDFICSEFIEELKAVYFIPVSILNALRRGLLEKITLQREQNRPRSMREPVKTSVPFPEKQLTYAANVLNRKAERFYHHHGVTGIESAAEAGLDMAGQKVMTTRYCIKHELGYCDGKGHPRQLDEPLYLVDESSHRYLLRFLCQKCQMEVFY